MSSKPSWDGKDKQFTRMMHGNGYVMKHQKGSHCVWSDGINTITLGNTGHLRNELVWKMIRKYKLEWKEYL